MGDDYRLPPLEDVIDRLEDGVDETCEKMTTSRAPRFYMSNCVVKEEWDKDGRIQVAEQKKDGHHNVVCKYFEQGHYCNRLYNDCPHSTG